MVDFFHEVGLFFFVGKMHCYLLVYHNNIFATMNDRMTEYANAE